MEYAIYAFHENSHRDMLNIFTSVIPDLNLFFDEAFRQLVGSELYPILPGLRCSVGLVFHGRPPA